MGKDYLLSVGIDLGTATTQMVIAKLSIKNMATVYTVPRVTITEKEVIYQSPSLFTPLRSNHLIDFIPLERFISQQYKLAGISKESIDIGAIIITGESARKENAETVTQALSEYAGDFVVATAGPDLESILAGRGAGAQSYSKEHHTTIVNLDIGGGTTNLALFYDNEVISTSCLDVGGRLIKIDQETQQITYIAPKLQTIIEGEGFDFTLGKTVSSKALKPLLKIMVQLLANSLNLGPVSPYYQGILRTESLLIQREIKAVSFSGGVADYIKDEALTEPFKYGDIGLLLGVEIAQSEIMKAFNVLKARETLRATVVGAGSHATSISGSTITYRKEILPIKNRPVLKLSLADEEGSSEQIGQAIRQKLNWFKLSQGSQAIALGLVGEVDPSFQRVGELAAGVLAGLGELIENQETLVISVEEDMAKALGQSIGMLLPKGYPFVCFDRVAIENGDYLDIGRPVAAGDVLPVVVKTLIFN
ncbi:ethanolamine ammonia-lyase reactivating factor EutA [Vagococcus salmoninarum]|uniref:ethanolamine ammonia-lyase reactivating factor EutA n=2 Tax=Vagococcus salmoninarum TaxID=2739 RepID=UPI003F96404F